jgi:hypothetical protein
LRRRNVQRTRKRKPLSRTWHDMELRLCFGILFE